MSLIHLCISSMFSVFNFHLSSYPCVYPKISFKTNMCCFFDPVINPNPSHIMKKVLFIILFLTMSVASFAQQDVIANNNAEIVETVKAEKPIVKKALISAKVKAKVLKINRKKSNEIISIKAYRKSLQIKVKTKKLC